MMKHFNIKELEENIDYYISVNELGDELISDLIKHQKRTMGEIIEGLKNTLILWYFHIKLCNAEEKYEISAKIKRVIELEKQDAINQLTEETNVDIDKICEFVESIDEEIQMLS